jgi:hypothetical protein
MNPLAYYHYYHGYGTGSWVAHMVAGSLIHRAVWAVTRGMSPLMLIVLAIAAVAVVAGMARR